MSAEIERATYTVAETAQVLGLSAPAVYKMLQAGKIPHRRFGAKWIIPKAALHRWLDETTARQKAEFGGFLA